MKKRHDVKCEMCQSEIAGETVYAAVAGHLKKGHGKSRDDLKDLKYVSSDEDAEDGGVWLFFLDDDDNAVASATPTK